MLIKKYIQTYLDIEDPNDMLSANRDEMLLSKLTDKFVGKCCNSCLILKINKIVRRSYIYMKDTLNGDAHSSIMFEVDALVYTKNEILNGCTIIKKEPNGVIHAKSEYGGIQINIPRNLDIFKEQDVVPVIVKQVRYNINQTEITIKASPFIPMNEPLVYYKPTGILDDNQLENISKIIKQINYNESSLLELSTNDNKIIKFFVNLLNDKSKINTKLGRMKKISMCEIKVLSSIKSGIIVRENSFNDNKIMLIDSNIDTELSHISLDICELSSDIIEISIEEKERELSKIFVVEESIYNIYVSILLQYLGNLQALFDFLKHYPTFASVQQNKSIWKIYNMLKK
jgi:hypothetical protein